MLGSGSGVHFYQQVRRTPGTTNELAPSPERAMTVFFDNYSFATIFGESLVLGSISITSDIDGGPAVRWVDLAGYCASILVFMTFYMKDMVRLRLLALCSNVAFLLYACPSHLFPIVALHGALIPINIRRLIVACRDNTVERDVRPQRFDCAVNRSNSVPYQACSPDVRAAGDLMKPLHRQSRILFTNESLLKPTSDFQYHNPRAIPRARQGATRNTWTRNHRALMCVIGALAITLGIFAVITTAPAGRSELSFCEPVG
jgi:hypothetical protein